MNLKITGGWGCAGMNPFSGAPVLSRVKGGTSIIHPLKSQIIFTDIMPRGRKTLPDQPALRGIRGARGDPESVAVIDIVTDVKEAEWRDYVEAMNSALWYTPEWSGFLGQTFTFPRHHLFAIDGGGAVQGFLPLFRVASRITGDRLSSAPFTPRCGPLGEGEVRTALLTAACRLRDNLGTKCLEIHEKADLEEFQAFDWYSTHQLDLTPGPEAIRKGIVNKNIRRDLSRSEELGLEVERSQRPEDTEIFHRLNLQNKKALGVLCHPSRFCRNLFRCLPGLTTLYIARNHDEPVAGGIFLRYRDDIMFGYAASAPAARHFSATKLILWECIRDASTSGARLMDFGRVSNVNAGLIQYRKSWGAEGQKLWYSYYPAPTGCEYHTRDTSRYRLGKAAIRVLPVPLYSMLSDRYFGIFG